MRPYDPTQPLIFIHVPKTAGISVRNVVKDWFPNRLHLHYNNEALARLPTRLDANALANADAPPVIYGHFNRLRGFGIQDYYPDIKQCVTILRDPFEAAVSSYFYIRAQSARWSDKSLIPGDDLEHHLRSTPPNILNHFPREITQDNYRDIIEEYFIEIGLTEHLSNSLQRIATALNQPFDPASLPVLNATPRTREVPDGLAAHYEDAHPLEYAVYAHVKTRFEGVGS